MTPYAQSKEKIMSFTWVPFYKELAQKVVAYQDRSKELADLIVEVLQEQMGEKGADWLRDKNAQGTKEPLDAIDPFTFFATFNRRITQENRIGILTALKQRMQVSATVPSDFDGIPVMENRKSMFFPYATTRKPEDIRNLWKLAVLSVVKPPMDIPSDLFDVCVRIEQVSLPKLTIGLFWFNPDQYLAVDSLMRGYLENNFSLQAPGRKATNAEYLQFVQNVKKEIPGKPFCDISFIAWKESNDRPPAHWVMALGERSNLWEDCRVKEIVRVGWDKMNADLGDLNAKEFKELHTQSTEGDIKGIKDFVNVMKPGDRVFIKQGLGTIIAYAEIDGDYSFDPALDTYRHLRRAKWLKIGPWDLPDGMTKFTQWTIKPLTEQSRIRELLELIGWKPKDGEAVDESELLPGPNIILYGPPGTGKTYKLKEDYFPLFSKGEEIRYKFVTFHQSFCYEDFVEGIKPVVLASGEKVKGEEISGNIGYSIKPGVFRELAEEARKDPSNRYALFIDEINRGNVASIFGELITLIEKDKRLNDDGDLEKSDWTATLPYSRQLFGVPKNLFIIGTMNTADRSIEALDTALRRRFLFIPTYPRPKLLQDFQPAGFGVNLESLLTAINERLEILLDRDHTIGHSHLMCLKDASDPLSELKMVFANSIIPLLQEFFYGNPSRIGMILGSAFVKKRNAAIELKKIGGDVDDFDLKDVYDITPHDGWDLKAFQSIYA